MALGLNWGQMMRLIILPQALKLVIPGIVNTFIGLFKDTTLVLIIGLFDFLVQFSCHILIRPGVRQYRTLQDTPLQPSFISYSAISCRVIRHSWKIS